MHDSLTLSTDTLYSFLLALARVASALTFVPLPGITAAPQPVRAAFALTCTFTLYGLWPAVHAPDVTGATLIVWVAAEASLGIAIGVCVAIALEGFTFAAQMLGVPAGYGFASTVDPNSEADSTVLVVLAQLVAGLLFFALGLHREVIRLFALSMEKIPAGTYIFGRVSGETLIRASADLFLIGVRLALPVTALLVMVDIAVSLLGRLNAQLQLMSLSFPAKMLVALLMLGWLAEAFPRILMESASHGWIAAHRVLGL
ncbi:MAG: flagellar biosynthetic protein FliR [Bryobacteraceae bacterium]